MRLVECVPNFSEGRRKEVVEEIVSAIKSAGQVYVLDVEMDPDHNRSVVTFVSDPETAVEAAFRGIKRAAELIDMDRHRGAHPRFGAADVIPFVPIEGVSMQDCVELAHRLGRRVGEELGIPVYLYDKAATREDRRVLSNIRNESFQYEQLKEAITKDERWIPDYGPRKVGKAGASIIGARDFLIAFNVNLGTRDLGVARAIARAVRGKTGGLSGIRALGFDLPERGLVQVSMNVVDYKKSPLHRAFELVKLEAERYGVPIVESEIVGLVPMDALLEAAEFYLRLRGFRRDQVLERRLWSLIKPSPGTDDFIDELSAATPAPGGGAASAVALEMGASLIAMVSGITAGKRKYAEVKDEMIRVRGEALKIKERARELRDEDTRAFEALLNARRMRRWSQDERRRRKEAILEATRKASSVPLETMRLSLRALELAELVASKGMKSAVSDVGTAAELLLASARGAYLNVLVNTVGFEDEELRKMADQSKALMSEIERVYSAVREKVKERMA